MPNTGSVFREDNKAITIEYQDGSFAVLEYFSIGSEHLEKERLEAHFDQKTIVLDNYTALKGYGIKVKKISTSYPEKGQLQELRRLSEAILDRQADFPIPLESIYETTDLCLRLRDKD
jgi:predicted dehydrogenase